MLNERGSSPSGDGTAADQKVRETRKLFYRYVIVNSFGVGGVVAAVASTLLVIVGLSETRIDHWSIIAALLAVFMSAIAGLRQWQHEKESIH